MAKSGKKRKKAEKSKTKLRQSIKLPKGLNETNAQVTSKKINVLNQLRTQDGADEDRLTRKKIGVRDLMSKLSNLIHLSDHLLIEFMKSSRCTLMRD